MKIIISVFAFGLISLFCYDAMDKAPDGNYTLVWSDEFDYEGLPDPTKWSYDVGTGCPFVCGWGNNEQEYYTKAQTKNARVENGKLIIEAHRERIEYSSYTSARLVTKGKGDWTYGRIEVRSKNPHGKGTWPAVWMLPSDNTYGVWPRSGEIDIMEHVGYEPDTVYGTVHTLAYNHNRGTQKGDKMAVPDSESEFHVYSIEWTAEKIDFFIDDQQYFSFENENVSSKEWPFDQPFHLILNIAVGGNWGGKQGIDPTIWPQKMEVDYVRVFQKSK